MNSVVHNISTSIMTHIEETVHMEIRKHLNTVGLTGYLPMQSQTNNITTTGTAITSQTATGTAALSLNLVTLQSCAFLTLNIQTTGTMITPIVATNVSKHNTVTSSSPDSL